MSISIISKLFSRSLWLEKRWGWVVCLASFTLHFGLYAFAYCFSLFFLDIQREMNATAVETGWIGSVIYGVQMFSSPVGTLLGSWFSYHTLIILVVIVSSVSIFLASFAKSIYHLYLTLGISYGLSLGTAYFIMLCVLAKYFPAKNNLRAVSFATLGSAAAMLAIAEPVNKGIAILGWRATLQYLSLFTLVVSLPAACLISSPDEHCDRTYSGYKKSRDGETSSDEKDVNPEASKRLEVSTVEENSEVSLEEQKIEKEGAERGLEITISTSRMQRWASLPRIEAALYCVLSMTSAMAWSVFLVNIR